MVAAAFVSLLALTGGHQVGPARIEDLVRPGQVTVEVLRLTAPDPYPTLAARFQKAARENRVWFLQWVERADPGPLPWHENLGLSRPEYEDFLALSEQMRYEPERRTTITVRREGRVLILDGGDNVPDLLEVEVDPVSMSVRTPLGTCSALRAIDSAAKATGPWRGFTCSASAGDVAKGDASSLVFYLGRLTETGNVFLSLHAKRMQGPDQLQRLDVAIRYAAPRDRPRSLP